MGLHEKATLNFFSQKAASSFPSLASVPIPSTSRFLREPSRAKKKDTDHKHQVGGPSKKSAVVPESAGTHQEIVPQDARQSAWIAPGLASL